MGYEAPLLPLSFFPVSSSPPLSFPSFSSGYFSGAGMLVLLLLPSSCDLNIKHRRKISPRAPSPGSILGPRQPRGPWPWGRRGCRRWAPHVPKGHPLHTHAAQAVSCPFPSQFPSNFSIYACLGRGIFNPLQLCSSGAEKGCFFPLGIYWARGITRPPCAFPEGGYWEHFGSSKAICPSAPLAEA